MKIERSVVIAGRRATSDACAVISDFVAGIARERDYPALAEIRAGFAKISPTLSVMLVTRALAQPAISVRMPDLRIELSVSYSPDDEDNLSVPDMGLLDKLSASAPIEIVLHATGTLHARQYDRVTEACSDRIRFALAAATGAVPDAVPDTVPAPPAPPAPAAPVPVPSSDPATVSDIDPDPYLGAQGGGVPHENLSGDLPVGDVQPAAMAADGPVSDGSFRYLEADGAADRSDDAGQLDGTGYPEGEGQDFLGQPADYE